ncbi:AlpA family transcriptional regulator [Minwuia sp. IMCC3077]|uniref:helix-turn-helix transcriptional regulator n=1 Tax=Minwuia sp. IMCC3077 TaxID=3040676 RepID=UPI00247AB161|nr:AlpA family transcriptional regulator [Minwuia sp. IMCC3077]
MTRKLIRRQEVEAMTGLCRSTIYLLMKRDQFPKSIKVGERSVRWDQSEVNNWIDERVAKRDQEN